VLKYRHAVGGFDVNVGRIEHGKNKGTQTTSGFVAKGLAASRGQGCQLATEQHNAKHFSQWKTLVLFGLT
jgi:hypothetical protein